MIEPSDTERAELPECTARYIEDLEERVEELSDPGWHTYLELTQKWLEKYPPDIFTGESGDPGHVFVVAIRNAVAKLQQASE